MSQKNTLVIECNLTNEQLLMLGGICDEHFIQIEKELGVEIASLNQQIKVTGYQGQLAASLIYFLIEQLQNNQSLNPTILNTYLQPAFLQGLRQKQDYETFKTPNKSIQTRGFNQTMLIRNIRNHDINFAIGPAGCGKTWLSCSEAVRALNQGEVEKIILCSPAIEAGEKLGFLPGDIYEKVDPYLQPLYDALFSFCGVEKIKQRINEKTIEILPFAYMRGRTLNNAFVVIDEAQNATFSQLKTLLTRIGIGSKMVLCGDISQIDLQNKKQSGLNPISKALQDIDEVSITYLNESDIVRHRVIAKILKALETKVQAPAQP